METAKRLDRATDHFWARYNAMTEKYPYTLWLEKGLHRDDWDLIRRLVCHVYGVTIPTDLTPEQVDPANDLAIQIIDQAFDRNDQILSSENP